MSGKCHTLVTQHSWREYAAKKGQIPAAESASVAPEDTVGGMRRPNKAKHTHSQNSRACSFAHRLRYKDTQNVHIATLIPQDIKDRI